MHAVVVFFWILLYLGIGLFFDIVWKLTRPDDHWTGKEPTMLRRFLARISATVRKHLLSRDSSMDADIHGTSAVLIALASAALSTLELRFLESHPQAMSWVRPAVNWGTALLFSFGGLLLFSRPIVSVLRKGWSMISSPRWYGVLTRVSLLSGPALLFAWGTNTPSIEAQRLALLAAFASALIAEGCIHVVDKIREANDAQRPRDAGALTIMALFFSCCFLFLVISFKASWGGIWMDHYCFLRTCGGVAKFSVPIHDFTPRMREIFGTRLLFDKSVRWQDVHGLHLNFTLPATVRCEEGHEVKLTVRFFPDYENGALASALRDSNWSDGAELASLKDQAALLMSNVESGLRLCPCRCALASAPLSVAASERGYATIGTELLEAEFTHHLLDRVRQGALVSPRGAFLILPPGISISQSF